MKATSLFSALFAVLVIAIAFIDRPLAIFAHTHLHGVALFPLITHIADVAFYAAIGVVAVASVRALGGWRPGPLAQSLIVAAIATLVASVLKDQLKIVFGRTWPETWVDANPSFIQDGVFGFFPFHGGRGWASFPSGHTAVIAAPVASLWQYERVRWVGAVLIALVIIGLLGADYHFLSDVVAGLIVGIVVGAGAARMFQIPDICGG